MKLLRERIRSIIREMAYIDDPIMGTLDPRIIAGEREDRERLKRKRARLPGNWKIILSVLSDGGYITEPYMGRKYTLFDASHQIVRKIHAKTVDELSMSGFLEYESEPSPENPSPYTILSDEGRGYLK